MREVLLPNSDSQGKWHARYNATRLRILAFFGSMTRLVKLLLLCLHSPPPYSLNHPLRVIPCT